MRSHGIDANGVSTSIQQREPLYKSDNPPRLSTSGDRQKVKNWGEFSTNGRFHF